MCSISGLSAKMFLVAKSNDVYCIRLHNADKTFYDAVSAKADFHQWFKIKRRQI